MIDAQRTIPIVEATDIGVKYVSGRKGEDLKSLILNPRMVKGEFWALRSFNFTGFAGDVIGIIGSNGAGKTTLCSVVSRLLRPDEGEIVINGEVSALLSLGTGFNKDLTGKENIFLNGMMLGASKRHLKEIYQDIVDFSGLGDFINQPIKRYSSGMRARLGFSIATMLNPDILVLDEALSTGDAEFRSRASAKTKEMVRTARVVIIVSHDIEFVEQNCSKVVWIDKGKLVAEGAPAKVCSEYRETVKNSTKPPTPPKRLKVNKTVANIGEETIVQATNLGLSYRVNGKDFWALRDCNFSVKQGEIVGIIGSNGAGKSTLCKLMSGILKPDAGALEVNGEISALLSLGSGFNKQLTGKDNIYLNGQLLGIPKRDLDYLYDDIVAFSGLEGFIDVPVKNYSKGMISRLGFSIATMLEPDIFIIDEALSTGDMAFYEKASKRIQQMITTAKAVIIVTHSMAFVKKVCTKAIWVKQGSIMHIGDPAETIDMYKSDQPKKEVR